MIIACEQCETRFHVDDARVPERGIRVRCSRCKHAFFVQRPGSDAEQALHDVAAEAVEAAKATVPGDAFELDGEAASAPNLALRARPRRDAAPPQPQESASESEEEEDWQFAIEPPEPVAERRAPEERTEEAPSEETASEVASAFDLASLRDEERERPLPAAPPADPETSSLADLDNPESWNLLPEQEGAPAPVAPASPARPEQAPRSEPSTPPRTTPRETRALRSEVAVEQPAPAAVAEVPAPLARLASFAGAALLVVGFALGLAGALRSAMPRPPLAPEALRVAGMRVSQVETRRLENAYAGTLFVVAFRAEPAGASPAPVARIRVVPLDANGAPLLDAASPAGTPLPDPVLREFAPAELRARHATAAAELRRRNLAPGETLPLQAVLDAPPAATHFVLEAAPAS